MTRCGRPALLSSANNNEDMHTHRRTHGRVVPQGSHEAIQSVLSRHYPYRPMMHLRRHAHMPFPSQGTEARCPHVPVPTLAPQLARQSPAPTCLGLGAAPRSAFRLRTGSACAPGDFTSRNEAAPPAAPGCGNLEDIPGVSQHGSQGKDGGGGQAGRDRDKNWPQKVTCWPWRVHYGGS